MISKKKTVFVKKRANTSKTVIKHLELPNNDFHPPQVKYKPMQFGEIQNQY